jgi:hypothetical protein
MKSFFQISTKAPLSFVFCLIFSTSIWLVLYPGVYSVDSLGMVYAAVHGHYYDWQPVPLPVLLNILLRIGGNPALVTLLQALAGTFGVRQLGIELGRFLKIRRDSHLDLVACTTLLILSSPLSLFPIYMVTLWTDIWLSIFLVWAIAILINIYRESGAPSNNELYLKVPVLVCLLGLALLVRYNGLVLIPLAILVLERTLARADVRPRIRILIALMPLAIVLIFRAYQSRFLQVESDHPEHVVYAVDLASMILQNPAVCHDLSLESCDIVLGAFPNKFIVGNGAIDNTFNQGRGTLSRAFLDLVDYPELLNELQQEVHDHPLLWASVKVSNYLDYLRPDPSRFYYPEHIVDNDLGLSYENSNPAARIAWFSMTDWVSQNPLFRWFSFVHVIWLIINILGMITCLVLAVWKQNKEAAFLALILAIPLTYYFSYLLALTASDFRFMYPSTLILQVMSVAILCSLLVRLRAARRVPGMSTA